eukprot:6253914-Prymnesium_polylepis.1
MSDRSVRSAQAGVSCRRDGGSSTLRNAPHLNTPQLQRRESRNGKPRAAESRNRYILYKRPLAARGQPDRRRAGNGINAAICSRAATWSWTRATAESAGT